MSVGNGQQSFFKVISRHLITAVLVKLNADLFGELIEMIELHVADVVAHEYQHAASLDPISNRFDMRRFDVIRMLALLRRVGIDNDVDVRSLEIRGGGRFN